MQVAMLALQLQLEQMGVQRIFLDAASEQAKGVWTSTSLGFTEISDDDYSILARHYTLVENVGVAARCMKVVPSKAALLDKLSVVTPRVAKDLLKVKKQNMGMRSRRVAETPCKPDDNQLHSITPMEHQADVANKSSCQSRFVNGGVC